ncbi:MAG: S9 family peptidase [Crocinitomicaceae bacterium]|nr:S9 family peptidase [Crocinitomicaceae bacterium]|tara:strand:- start:2920 stop:5091 length:2172 start_codon:yes stop_codon:yes gene_type:complete
MKFKLIALLIGVSTLGQSQSITLEDIWASGKFRPQYVYGLRSMNDGLNYTELINDRGGEQTIIKTAYADATQQAPILSSGDLAGTPNPKNGALRIEGYTFSGDEKKIMIRTGTESIYRHSTREWNYVVDVETKGIKLVSEQKIRYASFNPSGNQVAFVRDNNVYVSNLENGSEIQVTSDGENNQIINGATDWVYEEEFAFDKAFFWSPNGKKIAYYRFMEGGVREFNMPYYKGGLYPEDYKFKYPKAGEDNSRVSIFIYDLESKKTSMVEIKDYYIPRIKWSKSDDYLTITGMNRHQNNLKLYWVNANTMETKVILEEQNDTYIDIHDNLTFLSDNKSFVWTSEIGGYNHLYLYSNLGQKKSQITKGDWEVTKVYGLNEKSGVVYFEAAKESPMQREVYSVKVSGSSLNKLSPNTGTNSASFSKGFKYFINYHSTAKTPYYISVHDAKGKEIRVMKDNQTLKELIGQYATASHEFLQVPGADGTLLNSWMIKPKNFDADKKYPVLMFVYGGPGSQTVKDSWGSSNYLWYQMLADKGYIVVSVDNRGTGARGEQFKKMTYLQLGKYETEDQIAAAQWLGKQGYVDASRIGIWGWSYGGYMSSLCLFKGADVFKMAMAVAPVTNWKFYDTIYTERYMQTPEENSGYEENSPINHVEKLKGKYLLIHGTGDDNVHFQNSVEMVAALQKANKQFDLMIYPDRNHGIYGGNTRLHLYNMMTDYVMENL